MLPDWTIISFTFKLKSVDIRNIYISQYKRRKMEDNIK